MSSTSAGRQPVYTAGALQNLGDHFFAMLGGWAQPALLSVGALIVVVTMVRRFSLKAGIGALLAFVMALGIYQARSTLSSMFANEVQSAANGAATAPAVLPTSSRPAQAARDLL